MVLHVLHTSDEAACLRSVLRMGQNTHVDLRKASEQLPEDEHKTKQQPVELFVHGCILHNGSASLGSVPCWLPLSLLSFQPRSTESVRTIVVILINRAPININRGPLVPTYYTTGDATRKALIRH